MASHLFGARPSCLVCSLRYQSQINAPSLSRHRSRQHWASFVQGEPSSKQAAQAGSVAQSGSSQSERPSQSLSDPSEQVTFGTSDAGGAPQSTAQLHSSSPGSQTASPQTAGGPQSMAQFVLSSVPSQIPSPQHEAVPGASMHWNPPSVHRGSLHGTGLSPSPRSPQQNGPALVPAQSSGHRLQFSRLKDSHIPFPQPGVTAPPLKQSAEQVLQSSPASHDLAVRPLRVGTQSWTQNGCMLATRSAWG